MSLTTAQVKPTAVVLEAYAASLGFLAGQRTIWHNTPIGVGGKEEAENGQHQKHQHDLGNHHENNKARIVMQPMGRNSQQPRA